MNFAICSIDRIKHALEKQHHDQLEILLYKKNSKNWFIVSRSLLYLSTGFSALETPMWILMQVAPIKNEREVTALYLMIFKDITALKQPIEEEENKGTMGANFD